MRRARAVEVEFTDWGDPTLLAHVEEVRRRGTGWINVSPVVEEEHEPPEPGLFAFLGGSVHRIPTVTWMPGRIAGDGSQKPTTVGLQHAAGPHIAWKLRDAGIPVPEGWRVTQDHPRRGLVAQVPVGADDGVVLTWLLEAAVFACSVPTTGRWTASVHAGVT